MPLAPLQYAFSIFGMFEKSINHPKKILKDLFWKSWIKIDETRQNRKSYLENRKSYEFLNAIFEFRLKDLFWKSWIKIED